MNQSAESQAAGVRRFRVKLLIAMMAVVSTLTLAGIFFAQRRAAADAQGDLQRDFELELSSLHRLQDLRNAAVADRSRALAQNARIHAALEDNALDLLYPSAREELRDLMQPAPEAESSTTGTLHARFYRFLDAQGAVIRPPLDTAGALLPNEEARLAQSPLAQKVQTGYLTRLKPSGESTVDEMIAVPVRSSETNEVISALVLGFKPVEAGGHGGTAGMKSGIMVDGKLQLTASNQIAASKIAEQVKRDLAQAKKKGGDSLRTTLDGVPHLLFYNRLNPDSAYSPAYEVCLYPLDQLLARQAQLRWQILGAGGLLLVGGFVVSQFFSRRLSKPVEKLAVASEENYAQRQRAEAELLTTAEELQRSARFSADASHQLKSPITVLRAGLDSLLTRDGFPQEVYEEISNLIHQTYRLTGVVEDLLLLSRMDAGKLRLSLNTVDLTHLVEEWLDDLKAMPEAAHLEIETEVPEGVQIAGEVKYTSLVVQNLLDNARKYNRPGGTIRIVAREQERKVELVVANTGRGIPAAEQPYIFERFHRAGASADVPGHGLGLNLARELVRLHGGELSLVRSDGEWTEFRVIFHAAVRSAQPVTLVS